MLIWITSSDATRPARSLACPSNTVPNVSELQILQKRNRKGCNTEVSTEVTSIEQQSIVNLTRLAVRYMAFYTAAGSCFMYQASHVPIHAALLVSSQRAHMGHPGVTVPI